MKMITVETNCPFCGKAHFIDMYEEDFLSWRNGELIQEALWYLSADEREMLISGICPTCWDKMFSDDEDEDEEEPDDLEVGFDPYEGCYTWDC